MTRLKLTTTKLATNNKYITVHAYTTQLIDIWAYRKYLWSPPSHPHNAKFTFDTQLWTWCAESHTGTRV